MTIKRYSLLKEIVKDRKLVDFMRQLISNESTNTTFPNSTELFGQYYNYTNPNYISSDVSMPLINSNIWYGVVALGTPPQYFKILFDTGSSDFWVRSASCGSVACKNKEPIKASNGQTLITNPFDYKKSTTFSAEKTTSGEYAVHKIKYGTGTVNIIIAKDTLRMQTAAGSITLPNEDFGMTLTQSAFPFVVIDIDGIMGLGFNNLAINGTTSTLENMRRNGVISQLMFSYWTDDKGTKDLSDDEGQILFGGYNSSKISGEMKWIKITHPSYWTVRLTGLYFGDYNLLSNYKLGTDGKANVTAIMDTGTGGIVLPRKIGSLLRKQLSGFRIPFIGMVVVPCDQFDKAPPLKFHFTSPEGNIHVFEMKASDYLTQENLAFGYCYSSILSDDMKTKFSKSEIVLVGAAFLEHYYTTWDIENHRLGLGILA